MKTVFTRIGFLVFLILFSYQAGAFYDSNVGRWISRDPIGERGGKNLYGFVNNHAIGKIDPLGLNSVCCAESINILPQIDRYAYRNNIGNLMVGHHFYVQIKLNNHDVGSNPSEDCSLSWVETSSMAWYSPAGTPVKPFDSLEVYADSGLSPTLFNGWKTRTRIGEEYAYIEDYPMIVWQPGSHRRLRFDISVTSAKSCLCAKKKVSVSAIQTVTINEFNQIDTLEFKTLGQNAE